MPKIRQVLRFVFEECFSDRKIARLLEISRDSVRDYRTRALASGLAWPIPECIDDIELETKLFPPRASPEMLKPEPDYAYLHSELKRKGASLQVLHQEFLESKPNGIGYSLFCQRYRMWAKTLKAYLRQVHTVGERVFVDYSGQTRPIHNALTGGTRTAQIFVGVLGASNYTYAEAHWSQRLPDWICAHTRMFEYFGGATQIIVCDNLKSGVAKASLSEPEIHPTYKNMAAHYGAIVIPARPKKPKDKAKVEGGVGLVGRWILFRLRNQKFFDLNSLNEAIKPLLAELNNKPFQKMPGSRRSSFEAGDLPALRALPIKPYEYTEFMLARVGPDGMFKIGDQPYSAPPNTRTKEVELRVTANVVEVIDKGKRIASHERGCGQDPIIDPKHFPATQTYFGFWKPEIELEWAASVGPHAIQFMQMMFSRHLVKEQGYRSALAIKRLAREFGNQRLESACKRALEIQAYKTSSIRSILRTGLDQQEHQGKELQEADFNHPNVRGANYYL